MTSDFITRYKTAPGYGARKQEIDPSPIPLHNTYVMVYVNGIAALFLYLTRQSLLKILTLRASPRYTPGVDSKIGVVEQKYFSVRIDNDGEYPYDVSCIYEV